MNKKPKKSSWTPLDQMQTISTAMSIATTAQLLLGLRRTEEGKKYTDFMVNQEGIDKELCSEGTKIILLFALPFAVELCLKALKAQGGNEFIRTHNLKCLWDDLHKGERAEIRKRVEDTEWRNEEWRRREAHGITGKARTVDDVMEAHQNDFEDWRYVPDGVKKLIEEKKALRIDEAFMDLLRVVIACVEYHMERESQHSSAAIRNQRESQMPGRILTFAKTGTFQQGGVRVGVTKESLESFLAQISEGPAIPVIPDHDPFAMPIGKVTEAWLEALGDEHVVRGRIHLEEVPSVEVHSGTGVALTRLNFADAPKPFVKKAYGRAKEGQCTLSVDLANFSSIEDYDRFAEDVRLIDDSLVCHNGLGRHSLTPEPLIQFVLANPEAAALIAWILRRAEKFARHTIDETLKKVGDDISDYLSSRIKRILRAYTNRRKQDIRPTVVQVIIPGEPELCLLVKIEPGEEFPTVCRKNIEGELEKYRDVLKEANQIVMARAETNDWQFLYATTQSGKVIGTRECYENTLKSLRSTGLDVSQ